LVLFPNNAYLLTLILLRTDATANRRETIAFLQLSSRTDEIPFINEFDKSRDIDFDWTSLNAFWFLTLKAAT
jgi:hypothetical protein